MLPEERRILIRERLSSQRTVTAADLVKELGVAMATIRRDLAISQLCHSDKSVLEIAHELGFAEASAFHRAFKKWTGTRPGEYRRALAGQ